MVYDEKGKEYIDLAGGYGVAIVGHANPVVTNAITDQAKKLITCHGSFYNDTREKYLGIAVETFAWRSVKDILLQQWCRGKRGSDQIC